ncbi:DUF1493 family protein [Pseudomonas sp. App30]|uniref:DUF1493 family protein n=1 Tax=Pseudomonas sp. App30 TaxID=3068990 RepID=UPI003A80CCE5
MKPFQAMNRATLDDILRRVHAQTGLARRAFETLSLATSFAADLGIDGDDANELVPMLFHDYGVNVDGYDPCRYFAGEGFDWFWFSRDKNRRGNQPLTIGMLLSAIENGKWDTELLEGRVWSAEPLYRVGDVLPVAGYAIRP